MSMCWASQRRVLAAARVLGLAALCVGVLAGCLGEDRASNAEKERAVTAALRAYADAKARGTDFSNGPCIAEEVVEDWSVDIAHDPRQPIDDEPENQCQAYRKGDTHHFVELDPEGNVLRVK
jgi:hypothetical protein